MRVTRSELAIHHHVIPTGCPPDRLAWRRLDTARNWGRKLYGARGYRLVRCHSPKCAVYPPTPNPDAIPAGG